jgi:hypothetical protein
MKSAFKLVEKSIQFPEKKEKESKPKVSDPIFQIPLPLCKFYSVQKDLLTMFSPRIRKHIAFCA